MDKMKSELYKKLSVAERQIKDGEPLLNAEDVFSDLKRKYGGNCLQLEDCGLKETYDKTKGHWDSKGR